MQSREEEILRSLQEVRSKKKINKKTIFEITVIVIFIAVVISYNVKLPVDVSPATIKVEDVAFISQSDFDFQQTVKNITGYDWAGILDAKGDDKSRLTALILLSKELADLEELYSFVDRSAGINKDEFVSLHLESFDTKDTNVQNVIKLIENSKRIYVFYKSKNLTTAQTRINRLDFLMNYINKFGLAKVVISEGVDTSEGMVSNLIQTYNAFTESKYQ